MKTYTLSEMLETNSFENLLHLKRELLRYKKAGLVFVPKRISDLELNEPVELYIAYSKGTIEYYSAFPIVNKRRIPSNKNCFTEEMIKQAFLKFYGIRQKWKPHYYECLSCYPGKYFTWFYINEQVSNDGK
ncbi:hypothetical protein IM538_03910 [Cytobacillus suaedae]|nr:hypothetical protein IM538_03910 [Cytobacillus suaedae]